MTKSQSENTDWWGPVFLMGIGTGAVLLAVFGVFVVGGGQQDEISQPAVRTNLTIQDEALTEAPTD